MIDNLYPDRVTIEEGATVSAHSTILAHDEAAAYARGGEEVVKPVRIGKCAFIGVHCVILPGITIGDNSIVGAGSVVTHDIPPRTTFAGVPARQIQEASDRA
jgi:maltose O-acetyltransferase